MKTVAWLLKVLLLLVILDALFLLVILDALFLLVLLHVVLLQTGAGDDGAGAAGERVPGGPPGRPPLYHGLLPRQVTDGQDHLLLALVALSLQY